MIVYIGLIFLTVGSEVQVNVTPEMITSFQHYAGIDYDIASVDAFIGELAVLAAQTGLTTFLVYTGLLLVLFVEPPIHWFVGGDEFSGDIRPTLVAGALLVGFLLILLIEPFRIFAELLPLPLPVHLLILAFALLWMLVLRLAWRQNWMEHFLKT